MQNGEHYFNTVNLAGDQLVQREVKAGTQDAEVLAFFELHWPGAFAPSEVTRHLGQILSTSTRRAISNLTRDGYLICLHKTRPGPYGHPEHLWRLRQAPESQETDPAQRPLL